MNVLSLCDHSGNMLRPWAEAGYHCTALDIRNEVRTEKIGDGNGGSISFWQCDIRYFIPPLIKYEIIFGFPPCTNLAISGARWFPQKGLGGLIGGLELVEACKRICEAGELGGAKWMIENPISTLSSYWRKPDYIFDPYEYAGYLDDPTEEAYPKKTCLWTGGGFVMPEKRAVSVLNKEKIHNMPQTEDRGFLRSVTPMGFAKAVFEANH